jgi:ssDNA-binding Zn-finger/Zn-ribbon topoisomerase 1
MSPEIIRNMKVEKEGTPVESPNAVEHSPVQDVKAQEVYQEIQAKIVTGGPDIDGVEGSASLTNQKAQPVSHDTAGDQVKATPITEEEDQELIDETGEEESTQDDDIANRIAAFEKDLALTCPICRENVLKEQSTAAGKIYYSCPSNDCNFISWGKPHLLECKRCKNPFLVEVTDTSGQIILKCPRATCQHRQGLSPKRVKVVRKRLVRRKK